MTWPLALLHGFTGNPENFHAVCSALEPVPPLIETPALLGHEPEPWAADFVGEIDRLARRLEARAPRWHLCGYSLGGRVALGLVVRHPEVFASVTLVGAQPGLSSEIEREERRLADERWIHLLDERGISAFADAWHALPLFATQQALPADILAAQRAARLRHDPRALAESLRVLGLGAMPPYWESLEAISVPMTLIAGELDTKFSKIAAEMARRLQAARVEIVPRVGHNVVLERPDAVARALSWHLAQSS